VVPERLAVAGQVKKEPALTPDSTPDLAAVSFYDLLAVGQAEARAGYIRLARRTNGMNTRAGRLWEPETSVSAGVGVSVAVCKSAISKEVRTFTCGSPGIVAYSHPHSNRLARILASVRGLGHPIVNTQQTRCGAV
jgi:hypothetical protein